MQHLGVSRVQQGLAYRIAVADKPGVSHQDYEDDGEAAVGGRLLHLLQVAGRVQL